MRKKPRRQVASPPRKRPAPRVRSLPVDAPVPAAPPAPQGLLYKVVELSTVDEGALEEAVNTWVRQGWSLDGVQFAMREASKRPAMAFVFFTRAATPAELLAPPRDTHELQGARERLIRLATGPSDRPDDEPTRVASPSAYERLRQLAGEDDEGAS